MTNRLEWSWKLDGFVDEQRYYCSETPIDIENLPLPKAVLAGDVRIYVDTDVEINKTYYGCFGSVKNGIEKVSAEILVSTAEGLWFNTEQVMNYLASNANSFHFLTGNATRSSMGASLGSGDRKWAGGVLGPDGKIYCVPDNSSDILIIDPLTQTATRSSMGASLSGSDKWAGAVLGPDGKIYCVPRSASDILIINKHVDVTPLPLKLALSPHLNKL